MKVRKGLPTRTSIESIAAMVDFVHNRLDDYLSYSPGVITYWASSQTERAEAFIDVLRNYDFEVEHQLPSREMCRNGFIRIKRKEPS